MCPFFPGPMVEINKEDRVVYNAGSNLEVSCIYQNTTTTGALGKGTGSDQKEKLTEAEQVGIYFFLNRNEIFHSLGFILI